MEIYYLVALIVLVLPVLIFASALRRGRAGICTACGHQGRARRQTRGSLLVELILWLLFLLPGLIYSVWRLSTRREVCAACGHAEVIPLDSPRGRLLQRQYGGKENDG